MFVTLLLLAVLISALSAGVSSGMFAINKFQLQRKAQLGDKHAKLIYGLYGMRYQLMATLLITGTVANTLIVVLLDNALGSFVSILISTIIIMLFGELLPALYLKNRVIPVAARLYPALYRIVVFSSPVTRPLGELFDKWDGRDTQFVYSKEELMRMFDGQKLSDNTDIAIDEARMIRKVLEFGDKKIRDVMTPRRMTKLVLQDDDLGPLLLNELHASGHSRFPVIADAKHNQFVGTLYIRDLAIHSRAKQVKDIMGKDVLYIHEEKSLDHALRTFLKTRHHLFIVVNNFEEFVGVLTIEDVLEEIIGKEIVDEFDQHEDLRAVAKNLAHEESQARSAAERTVDPGD